MACLAGRLDWSLWMCLQVALSVGLLECPPVAVAALLQRQWPPDYRGWRQQRE